MWINNRNLCNYCFSPLDAGNRCRNCGLSTGEYRADADLLVPGTNLIGKYIIGKTLGRGGFGATYLAYSLNRQCPVAIKEYFPNQIACRARGEAKVSIVSGDKRDIFQHGAKRFYEEAKTVAKFNNSRNVVDVYEFFYANDTVYYSMEYLEGVDLKGYIEMKGGRVSEAAAIKIMKEIGEALIVIHSTGTLHRDISPDNIFICKNGEVKLIDFGSAKQVVGEQSKSLSVILKQGFAPYEQYQKGGNQGMWTDIYALGATMYYTLTGKIPDDAMSRAQNPEIKIDPKYGISPAFVNIIDKCMRMKINERFQSAHELLGKLYAMDSLDVTLWDDPPTPPIPPTPPVPPTPPWGYPPSNDPPPLPPMPQKKDRSGLIKGLIIGGGILFIVAMLVTVFIELVRQANAAAPEMAQNAAVNVLEVCDAPTYNII